MKKLIRIIVGLVSLAIILVGFDVQAAKNGCYCPQSGAKIVDGVVQSWDESNSEMGSVGIDTEPECKTSSNDLSLDDGLPVYYYCTWYENDTRKTTWKFGSIIDLSKKNGCFCAKTVDGKETTDPKMLKASMEGCGEYLTGNNSEYQMCNWYRDDQLLVKHTPDKVGACRGIKEGNFCGQYRDFECPVDDNSPCALVQGKCEVAVNPESFCSKFGATECKNLYVGLCAWQGVGTDINKPTGEGAEVGPPLLVSNSTFDASVLNKLGTVDIKIYAGRLIKGVMGVLGSLTLVMFVYSGILFMTDRGNGENVDKAKQTAVWTSLGLVVIFASYAIINFILQIFVG